MKRLVKRSIAISQNLSKVEVTLIIFVICFVVASIVFGNTLMEQSRLRSLIGEINDMQSRIATFEAVYGYKPGDFPNASDFWGTDSCGGSLYGANGDGNGLITYAKLEAENKKHDAIIESFVAWCHMAMANMGPAIEVINDLTSVPITGLNLPGAKIGGAFHLTSGKRNTFGIEGNAIVVGIPDWDMSKPGALLTPKQARSIDTKIDDGNPDTGKVRAATGSGANEKCTLYGRYNMKYAGQKLCVMSFALDDDLNDEKDGNDGKIKYNDTDI